MDTTFAMYPAHGEFDRAPHNIRLGYPYLMEHAPWHVDDAAPDEEERFYRAHASRDFVHWGADAGDSKIDLIESAIATTRRPRVLHLGCGNEYIPGWINVDVSGRRLDIELDIDSCRTRKLPLDEGSVDGFYMCHVLEHVDDVLALMEELHRVSRPGAKLFVRMPYGATDDAWEDPTHNARTTQGRPGRADGRSADLTAVLTGSIATRSHFPARQAEQPCAHDAIPRIAGHLRP